MTNASPPEVGDVLSFWYLWRHEFEAGEESGRKARPCVVVVAVARGPEITRVAVAPITHAPPAIDRTSVELPTIVKAHLKLDDDAPSWIICHELNEFNWPGYDLAKLKGRLLIGRLPHRVLQKVRVAVFEAMRLKQLKITNRD